MRKTTKSIHCHLLQAVGSIFCCIRVHLNCFSTDPGQIFSDKLNSPEEPLWSKPSTAVLRKSHRTGRCLASQICNRQFTTKCSPKIIALSKRAILKLSMKNDSCLKIKLDRSDYHRLKQLLTSETISDSAECNVQPCHLTGCGKK